MKSLYGTTDLVGQCESWSCVDHGRCKKEGKLYGVYGGPNFIYKDSAQEYYYCDEAVSIDQDKGWIVEEITN